jgi:hypothetical protein
MTKRLEQITKADAEEPEGRKNRRVAVPVLRAPPIARVDRSPVDTLDRIAGAGARAAALRQLRALPPETLLTADDVLMLMPVPMTRRQWLEGVRKKRYPSALKVTSKLLYWRAADIATCVLSLLKP